MKKSEISESCAKLFAGEAIVEPVVRDAALAWVPDAMRFLDKAEAVDLEPVEGEPEDQAPHAIEAAEGADAADAGTIEADAATPDSAGLPSAAHHHISAWPQRPST